MRYSLDLELMEGQWVVFVPGLPGCYASDEVFDIALGRAPAAIAGYGDWLRRHGEAIPPSAVETTVETAVDEIHRAWRSTPEYEVNAFFASDRQPLTAGECQSLARLLAFTRADLLAAVDGLSDDDLAREPDGAWPISRILSHLAGGENWYLSRLGLAVDGLPDVPQAVERLALVRERLLAALPGLAGDERIAALEGEIWSPRKLARRALWHERDHTEHIWQVRRIGSL